MPDGKFKIVNKKKVLECIFIQRRDNHEWAIPGGMVEPGTVVSMTLIKEFREEALNVCHNDKEKAEKMTNKLKQTLFASGSIVRLYLTINLKKTLTNSKFDSNELKICNLFSKGLLYKIISSLW